MKKKPAPRPQSPKKIQAEIQEAMRGYLRSRKRSAVYALLTALYRPYRQIEVHKLGKKYRTAFATNVNSTTRRLSYALVLAAVPRKNGRPNQKLIDRRTADKWARLINAAYKMGIASQNLSERVRKAGGINVAIATWSIAAKTKRKSKSKKAAGTSPLHSSGTPKLPTAPLKLS